MKTLRIVCASLLAIGAASGLGYWMTRDSHGQVNANPELAQTSQEEQANTPREPGNPSVSLEEEQRVSPVASRPSRADAQSQQAKSTTAAQNSAPIALNQALDTLLSPKTSYAQKQGAWNQLRNAGKLDQAITELEQRTLANPTSPELPATLGQAYLQKAGSITDVREQGILGMKADQSFEAALNADASNWDARFWKAMAMSYWPPQLGKGKEVIDHCLELLKQQEVQPAQPQFAQTYVLLGDQYKKEGQAEYAEQVWKRGLGLFPEHEGLKNRTAEIAK